MQSPKLDEAATAADNAVEKEGRQKEYSPEQIYALRQERTRLLIAI
jgi:hypothetical protein